MRLVVFGLTVSSSWGNGHATLWRGLIRGLERRGAQVTFFERDQDFYADNRDLHALGGRGGSRLQLYRDWAEALPAARAALRGADAAMVTSYCPDAQAASDLIAQAAPGVSVFYDMDTPVTLARLAAGERPAYLPGQGLDGFDLVLSFTGGGALDALREQLGARRCAALYGHADPALHHRTASDRRYAGDLSYLGTYAADRQPALEALFAAPARLRPALRFVLAGSGYGADFPWTPNTFFLQHMPPPEHPAFFSSSRLTLNVTRADMAAMGWCPSGRLFEAAACATPVVSDAWAGLETVFAPGEEILIAHDTADVLAALDLSPEALARIGEAARARVLAEHTSDHRAGELLAHLAAAHARDPLPA